jgi:hypothetical protein
MLLKHATAAATAGRRGIIIRRALSSPAAAVATTAAVEKQLGFSIADAAREGKPVCNIIR